LLILTKTPKRLIPKMNTGATVKYTIPSNVFQLDSEVVQYSPNVAAASICTAKMVA